MQAPTGTICKVTSMLPLKNKTCTFQVDFLAYFLHNENECLLLQISNDCGKQNFNYKIVKQMSCLHCYFRKQNVPITPKLELLFPYFLWALQPSMACSVFRPRSIIHRSHNELKITDQTFKEFQHFNKKKLQQTNLKQTAHFWTDICVDALKEFHVYLC